MDIAILSSTFLALVLYLNTLDADFAYDDSRAIVKNEDLLPHTPIINIFYDDFWGTPLTHTGSHKSYRPLCVLTYRLNHFLGSLNPWGYHCVNIIAHVLTTALFTHYARLLFVDSFPALFAGLLFASHPVHTEAVAGIVGRADVLACFFALSTMIFYMKYVRNRDSKHADRSRFVYFCTAAVFMTCSMLCKEHGVTVLGVCVVYEVFVMHGVPITSLHRLFTARYRRLQEGICLLLLSGLPLIVCRVYMMGSKLPDFAPSDNPTADSDDIITRTLTFNLLHAYNAWLLVCPSVLSFDWSMESIPLNESVADFRNIFTVLFYTILALFCWSIFNSLRIHSSDFTTPDNSPRSASTKLIPQRLSFSESKHQRRVTSREDQTVIIPALSFVIIPYIPASNLFFYVGFVVAERILYISSVGICLLISAGANALFKRFCSSVRRKRVFYLLVSFVVVMYSVKTVRRNQDWKNEESLYLSGITVNPSKAWGNLANILNKAGNSVEAEKAYRNALRHRGNMADVHYNLGILLQEQGRVEESIASYRRAIAFRPKLTVAHLNVAILLADQGHITEAEKIYKHTAALDTAEMKDPKLHENTKMSALYNLGRLYTDSNRIKEAIDVFEAAVSRCPPYYPPHSLYNMLGEAHMKSGDYTEAERWYKKSLASKPDHIPAHLTSAKLAHKKNELKVAEAWFKAALVIDPNDSATHQHYAQYLADTHRYNESLQMYLTVLDKTPHNFEIVFNIANIFRQAGRNNEAETYYRKAAGIKPQSPSAHMNLGAMLHFNGKLNEAEQSYLLALRLNPGDDLTQQNLAKLRALMRNAGR